MRVMIVDDEYYARKALIKLIRDMDFTMDICEEAETGKQAVAYLKADEVDLVITDISMPEMDGLELAGYVAEYCPGTDVIIESGYAEFNYAKQAIRYGVKSYLTKPVKPEELREAIGELLKKKEPWRMDPADAKREGNNVIDEIKEYVANNYRYDISLRELASQRYFLNPSYLSRLFKAETGMNFSKYLVNYRMERGKELLQNTAFKVSEIADCVGYNDTSYFIHTFRRQYEMTPEQFRAAAEKR